jgi:tRNA A37 threonylcarbamoyladenosine dehydratase
VTLSSLNRNATAVRADVGTPKVVALREQMLRVAPSAQIEAIVALFDAAAAPRLLAGEPALVVDCIDDLATKAALLGYCVREGLPVLCALGAGGKGDCCAFHVGRLSEVFNDPIAASLLKRLKKQRVEGTDDEAPTTAPGEAPVTAPAEVEPPSLI